MHLIAASLRVVLVASIAGAVLPAAAVVSAPAIDPAAAQARAREVDCNGTSVPSAEALAALPAPRLIGLSGSVPIITMQPFAEFLIAMGYPESALRDPYDGALDQSSWTASETLAGTVAWHYEHDGMRPMLIGHSQGGMLVVRTLHELAGEFADTVAVYDPVTRTKLPRTTITDPYTGEQRPVVGLSVAFAAALATGSLPRLLLGQWSMLPLLRRIPDTTSEFTGFTIAWDPFAGNAGSASEYTATGAAIVRNVLLPAATSHIGMPRTEHLPANPVARAWIEAYRPDAPTSPPDAAEGDLANLLHAADLWFSIRRHWCREGQRRLAAPKPGLV